LTEISSGLQPPKGTPNGIVWATVIEPEQVPTQEPAKNTLTFFVSFYEFNEPTHDMEDDSHDFRNNSHDLGNNSDYLANRAMGTLRCVMG